MESKTKEVSIKENYSFDKIKDMTAMALVLKKHVVGHKLYSNIKGKNYVQVEGWAFAGGLMGLTPKVVKVENLSNGQELKWKADVEIVNVKTGLVVANGFALCSNKEAIKKGFDEYAVLSMAQTRAIGKAYRNLIGWVMKLAGYEGTPTEEMVKAGEKMPVEEVVAGPEGEPVYTCRGCGKIITSQEASYSKKMYGRTLCRADQKDAKRIK